MRSLHRTFASPFGSLTATGDGRVLHELGLPGRASPTTGARRAALSAFAEVGRQREYFDGQRQEFDLTLAPQDTPLQRKAWQAVQEVPYGRTITCSELARRIGIPGAARAAGSLNARNPVCVIIPCHRVVGADGSPTGYAGGLEIKRRLLDLELKRAKLVFPEERSDELASRLRDHRLTVAGDTQSAAAP